MSPQFHCAHFLHVPAPSAQYIGLLNLNPHGRTVRTITQKNEEFRSHCNCQSAIGDDVGGWLFNGLDSGKIYRKAPHLMGKSMVSCKFSLKPIHWIVQSGDVKWIWTGSPDDEGWWCGSRSLTRSYSCIRCSLWYFSSLTDLYWHSRDHLLHYACSQKKRT